MCNSSEAEAYMRKTPDPNGRMQREGKVLYEEIRTVSGARPPDLHMKRSPGSPFCIPRVASLQDKMCSNLWSDSPVHLASAYSIWH